MHPLTLVVGSGLSKSAPEVVEREKARIARWLEQGQIGAAKAEPKAARPKAVEVPESAPDTEAAPKESIAIPEEAACQSGRRLRRGREGPQAPLAWAAQGRAGQPHREGDRREPRARRGPIGLSLWPRWPGPGGQAERPVTTSESRENHTLVIVRKSVLQLWVQGELAPFKPVGVRNSDHLYDLRRRPSWPPGPEMRNRAHSRARAAIPRTESG